MATRRRGADLSDLKSRLNKLNEDEESDDAADAADAPESTDDDTDASASGDAPSAQQDAPDVGPARPARGAAAPASERGPSTRSDEDYTEAVSDTETTEAPSFELDDEDRETVSGGSSRFFGLIIAVVLSASIALVFGYLIHGVFESRKIVNSQIAEAGLVLSNVESVSTTLASLNNQLMDLPIEREFSEDFQAILEDAYGEDRPILRPRLLSTSRTLMAYNEDISRDLMDLAFQTQLLAAMVDRHLRLTRRDAEEIQREIQGLEDDRNHAIVFDFLDQLGGFNELRTGEGDTFTPMRGLAVSYETLELKEEDESWYYEVRFRDGQMRNVPVHDLITMNREMLIESPTTETALSRWQNRAAEIRSSLEGITGAQGRLRNNLETMAAQPQLFTL